MNAARAGITPIAWLIAPALLLFVLFFVLPFGVMAHDQSAPGNPVSNPNADFTTQHYAAILDDSRYLFRCALGHVAHRPDHHDLGC